MLDLYNKEADCALKTHDEVMDGYQQTIHETVALLNKYGTEFGKTKETDDFIKSQFAELMSNVRAEQAGKTFNTEVKSKEVKREEKEVPDKPESSGFRNYADGCYKIAMDVVRKTINKEYPNADAAVKDMHDRIESFKAESNMRDNQVVRYSRLTNILADELAARNGTKEARDIMSKISEGCEKTTGVDRAMDLLKASMQESKGEIRQVFHEYLENTLGKMSTEKEKQEFITKMAEKIPLSYDKGSFGYKQQFILANEAREFGLRAEGKKDLSNNNDVRRVAGYVADLYKKQANGEKGISAYKAYVALSVIVLFVTFCKIIY